MWFLANIAKFLWTAFSHRTPLLAASEKYEYTVYTLDLLKDCYNCILLSLIIKTSKWACNNFSFLIEKSFRNLSSLLQYHTYRF